MQQEIIGSQIVFTFLATVLGWIVIFSISTINATRTEAKDSLKEYNALTKEAVEEVFKFWTTINKDNTKDKIYLWMHTEQRLLMKLKNIRLELVEQYDFRWNDAHIFREFLEVVEIPYSDISILELLNGYWFEEEKAGRLRDATILAEQLYKESKATYYREYPNMRFKLSKAINIILLSLVFLPLPFLFFYFFFYQIKTLLDL
ncbi:hypothetical protein [Pseudoalteromonas sp. SG45-2]|uniref:hypothetical protein n=1 Tax=Pseudoalteromonas sp. SG45-2 TaxID=2760956 RepID=UPI001600F129|nr:hypothetical protein [Pseudoalteromonas sp. SG45-2]MBB1347810.1 hypothetical protein [Pseudoalteromonas sp. SG45-2]